MELNTFIYYGALINKNDYENLFKKMDIKNFYSTIFSKGLNFREVGEISSTWDYVIGKEIYWERNNLININDNFNKINDINLIISEEDKIEVRKKLLELNISAQPQYKIFSCWRIEEG